MRQRAVIAMAVALKPSLLILDEPTTALDVVVQQEIMAQIKDLQRELGFSVLFITHDMSLMVELSHRMAVMYGGRIVETAKAQDIYATPRHPYTQALMGAFPPLTGPRDSADGTARRREVPEHPGPRRGGTRPSCGPVWCRRRSSDAASWKEPHDEPRCTVSGHGQMFPPETPPSRSAGWESRSPSAACSPGNRSGHCTALI